MRGDSRRTWPAWLLSASLILALVSCDDGSNPAGPDPDPNPDPGDNPHVAVVNLIAPTTTFVNDAPPDWSPDGRHVVYAGKLGSSIWKMTTNVGDLPLLVTDPAITSWSEGSYTPGFLADGRIFYYRGWLDGDLTMHVMAADTSQVEADPPPTILRCFTGTDIGLTENQATSPHLLYMSGDGTRAVGLWRSAYTLDWRDEERGAKIFSRNPELLAGAPSFRISRDGERIAFESADGRIAWMAFDGDTAEPVGEGGQPSWSGNGDAIGYVTTDGRGYAVYDLASQLTVIYRVVGLEMRHPALDWDGDRIVFLTYEGENFGLSYGLLLP